MLHFRGARFGCTCDSDLFVELALVSVLAPVKALATASVNNLQSFKENCEETLQLGKILNSAHKNRVTVKGHVK